MTVHVAGSAEPAEPRDFWYPSDPPSSSEDQLNAKVDRLFQNITGDGAFEIKAGLGEATIQKHALSAFYHAMKDNETMVDPSDPSRKLKVIIQLTGTHPAPPVQVVPTAPADAPDEDGRKKKVR